MLADVVAQAIVDRVARVGVSLVAQAIVAEAVLVDVAKTHFNNFYIFRAHK
ncbi:hypothetical protein SDC9_211449 [bioreactor metagenome]|uniref:Uncharacterized protein n=1 Tax=bioreactor metagenome TaxID=1076179 RepID=A0A645JVD9_9ZZZZ